MPPTSTNDNAYRPLIVLGSLVLVVAALYWAQKVLIPIAAAFMLTFVLGPLVNLLQRKGAGRITAVVITVLLALALTGGIAATITIQVNHLMGDLPEHKDNIAAKISGLRAAGKGTLWDNLQNVIQDVSKDVATDAAKGAPAAAKPAEEPIPVRVEPSGFDQLQSTLGPVAEVAANIGFVIILVCFMLIQREDLRNRIVRLVGQQGLVPTTRAIDEATKRISRFIISQALINAAFGVILSACLFVIGVPYAFLWGFIVAVLRFVPYIGTWAAALLIIGFSVVIFPTWTPTIYVVAAFVLLEIVTANVVEPLVFGHNTGISSVALVVAAAFWTWLWGPMGLVLSTPMTACLVVLGKYVSNLQFFDVLLGDEPALGPEIRYYQRLLARDQDEATDLVEEYVAEHSAETLYDELLLPALILAKHDKERGELGEADERFILQVTREILDDLVPLQQRLGQVEASETNGPERPAERQRVCIIGCPARDEEDELALHMFRLLTESSGFAVEVLSSEMLTAEVLARVGQENIALVCIAALPPGGLAKTRYLCKRLRAEYPRLPIVIGRWGAKESLGPTVQRLQAAGATHIGTTLLETRDHAVPLLQALSHTTEPVVQAQSA